MSDAKTAYDVFRNELYAPNPRRGRRTGAGIRNGRAAGDSGRVYDKQGALRATLHAEDEARQPTAAAPHFSGPQRRSPAPDTNL